MSTTLVITRQGGFSGIQKTVTVTDPKQQQAILALLPKQPLVGIMGLARDSFSYSFRLKKGRLDRTGEALRSVPESQLTPDLREILAHLPFAH